MNRREFIKWAVAVLASLGLKPRGVAVKPPAELPPLPDDCSPDWDGLEALRSCEGATAVAYNNNGEILISSNWGATWQSLVESEPAIHTIGLHVPSTCHCGCDRLNTLPYHQCNFCDNMIGSEECEGCDHCPKCSRYKLCRWTAPACAGCTIDEECEICNVNTT